MSACERCWGHTYSLVVSGEFETQSDAYQHLVSTRTCTPEQQAGPDATNCEACVRRTRHQITGECMACHAPRRGEGMRQSQVREFHEAFEQTIGDTPGLRDGSLRAGLIAEEANETIRAIDNDDIVEAVDGLCDLIYVCLGAAVAWGVDLEPIFNEVHRTNMAKAGGPKRADGKVCKPPGWTGPRVAEMLEEQRRKAILAKGGITALLSSAPR